MGNRRTSDRIWFALHLILIIGAGVLLYYPEMNAPMKSYDDQRWLEDTGVRNTLFTIFDPTLRSKNPFATTYYIPLQSALFLFMVKLFGKSAFAFHALCLSIHLSASGLVYAFIRALTKKPWVAFLAGLLFVGHVGHVQSVTWVSATISHPWVTVFIVAIMLTWHRFLETGSRGSYVGTLILLITALLVRESAVIVPLLMLSLEILLHLQSKRNILTKTRKLAEPVWKELLKYVPFILTTIPIFAVSMYKYPRGSLSQNWGGVSLGVHPFMRLLDFSSLLVYPAPQGRTLKLGIVLVLMIFAAITPLLYKRRPLWLFCILWMGMALMPYTISNFNPALAVMRYIYPASVGYVLLFALLLSDGLEARFAIKPVKVVLWFLFGSYTLWHLVTLYQRIH